MGETFSGPGTMDLEHDRVGFFGEIKKIADFIELYLEFYWELEVNQGICGHLLLELNPLRWSNRT